ncbi:CPBP family intramembrane metalloprotease [Halobacillus litoralis]|uniref:CPBP family glutamic-type intramembrane protease n=1 Tax=Halobacillus litoralis TaxID=45668 RepID=UPI001CD51A39|nr:CPBP family glutamic-type intramembrane protease [Halobacillus litoralis]MCA0972177.1 CPBP family intramembrane metalloprotease [Halobacillus litoralis]
MKNKWTIISLFTLVGIMGGYLVGLNTAANPPVPVPDPSVLVIALTIQTGVLTFLLSLAGWSLVKRTELSLWKKSGWKAALISGIVVGLILQGSDRLLFTALIPELEGLSSSFSFQALLMGLFYGGVVEEVMMRFFLMSLIIFILTKIRKRKDLSDGAYWVAISITALLFAVGHFPANIMLFGELSPVVTIRALLLNGIGGIVYGYLFWRYGLVFSIAAHMMTHVTMQFVMLIL